MTTEGRKATTSTGGDPSGSRQADPVLVEKFRLLLTGQEKGYAEHAWDELARVAAEHYEEQR